MSTVDRRIKYLRRNENGNLIPYYFGTEPRFIDSTLNNNTRNLEEQLLLGNTCSISTAVNTNKTLYTVTKIFAKEIDENNINKDVNNFKIVSDYNILNTNLLLYIVVDERDGNYIIKTANSSEEGSSYNEREDIITLADNSIYTLKNLGHYNDSNFFNICTEKLYYNGSLISTKTIKGKVSGSKFTTYITIS